ncbi:alpha/beta hydrolase [Winogradskyella sp. R77965]|uniref:alpha/beta hydrolase n=1 Tax=Winogradskyella sp. R77965 TaxID=3093872 RepID=UPI0037DCF2DC
MINRFTFLFTKFTTNYRLILLLALFMLPITACNAQSTKYSFELIDVPSPSLKDALIDSHSTYKIGISLPPYYKNSDKKYPVVYNLSGYTVFPGQYPSTEALTQSHNNNSIKEMIVVDISGYNVFLGTMYANSSVTGNWEDFVTKDVINFIDKNYRTIPKKEARAIMGHSMGAAAVANISLKHTDKYSVVYLMSPAIGKSAEDYMSVMFSDNSILNQLEILSEKLSNVKDENFQSEIIKILDTFESKHTILWTLAYGMAFSPDLSEPLKMRLPFVKDETGKYVKNQNVYDQWINGFAEFDLKIKLNKQELKKYKLYSINCGNKDSPFILNGTKRFTELLFLNNIPYTMDWYDGDHSNRIGEKLVESVYPIIYANLEIQD